MTPTPAHAEPERLLTFILPVTFREAGADSHCLKWRRSVDLNVHARLRLLLDSFLHFFNMEDLDAFFIICPERDIQEMTLLLASLTSDSRFRILRETEVFPDLELVRDPATGQIRGWYLQQILKLSAAAWVRTPYYLPVDSDVVCVRPFGYSDLIEQGQAAIGVETEAFYRTIYVGSFAEQEARIKEGRSQASARLLGYERSERFKGM